MKKETRSMKKETRRVKKGKEGHSETFKQVSNPFHTMSFKKRRQNSHGTTMPTFIHRHHSYGIVATKSLGMDGWGRVGCLTHCVYSFTNTSARIQAHKTQTSKIHSRIYKIPLHLEHYTPAYLVEIIQPSCSGSGSSNEEYVCFKMGPRRSPLFQ